MKCHIYQSRTFETWSFLLSPFCLLKKEISDVCFFCVLFHLLLTEAYI